MFSSRKLGLEDILVDKGKKKRLELFPWRSFTAQFRDRKPEGYKKAWCNKSTRLTTDTHGSARGLNQKSALMVWMHILVRRTRGKTNFFSCFMREARLHDF